MLVAGIFQAHSETKRTMDKKFKERGYTLSEKRAFMKEVLGYTPYFSEMTISEKEEVIAALSKKTTE